MSVADPMNRSFKFWSHKFLNQFWKARLFIWLERQQCMKARGCIRNVELTISRSLEDGGGREADAVFTIAVHEDDAWRFTFTITYKASMPEGVLVDLKSKSSQVSGNCIQRCLNTVVDGTPVTVDGFAASFRKTG